jgi:uncharacterized integral membrane protein
MPTILKILTWLLRGLVFLVLLLLAMKNTEPVTLHFYFGQSWTAPLALVLFLVLAFGALLGLIAGLERLVAQRREILTLKREMRVRLGEGARRASSLGEESAPPRTLGDAHLGHS